MNHQSLFASVFILLCFGVQAQHDSTKLFSRAKGTLSHPVSHFTKLRNSDSLENKVWADFWPGNTYYSYRSDSIATIYEGRIVANLKIASSRLLLIKFGKYFIAYARDIDSTLTKGQYIRKGQFIGKLLLNEENDFEMSLLIYKGTIAQDPMDWLQ